uniref:Uncharacterized protein n=1 Tax=Triticum urartu TaxID=4572 RepID=A0A8R7PD80_TRIUA
MYETSGGSMPPGVAYAVVRVMCSRRVAVMRVACVRNVRRPTCVCVRVCGAILAEEAGGCRQRRFRIRTSRQQGASGFTATHSSLIFPQI